MTGVKKTVGAVILMLGMALMFCLCCLASTASAEGASSLTLVCKANNDNVGAMPWSIYRIGSYDGSKVTVEGDFTKYPVAVNDLSAAGLSDAASTFKEYAFTFKITPTKKGTTKMDGTLKFDGLEDGVYLIAAKNSKSGDKTYVPSPAIVFVDSARDPDMTVYPKITSLRTLADEYERFSVKKIWENDGGLPIKPNEIVVDIYQDYEFYQTVTLSESNDWSYSWEELAGSEWTIIERKLPENCTVIYRNDGRRYVVVNTYTPEFVFDWDIDFPPPGVVTTTVSAPQQNDEDTETTTVSFPMDEGDDTRTSSATGTGTTPVSGPVASGTDTVPVGSTPEDITTTTVTDSHGNVVTEEVPDNPPKTTKKAAGGTSAPQTTTTENKLPQTGQLWWPVPVMAILGLILIAAGGRILAGSKREDNE